jgi:hypothetical protein
LDKIKAVAALSQMDHCILSRDEAQKLSSSMGLDASAVPVYAIEHRPDLPKGARLTDCTEIGEKRMMIGADELVEWACKQLKVRYEHKYGRGSRLRECCAKLRKHFEQESD